MTGSIHGCCRYHLPPSVLDIILGGRESEKLKSWKPELFINGTRTSVTKPAANGSETQFRSFSPPYELIVFNLFPFPEPGEQ